MASWLEAESLGLRRGGRWLLRGVSLQLGPGFWALLGPNGAGKSSLLRLLSGEWLPTEGQVRLLGQPLGRYSPAKLALKRAFLPQQRSLAFPYTAREVVALGRLPHQRGRAESEADRERIEEALAATGALGLAPRPYFALSGGERTRIDLARVLAQDTPILLLDEPTNHLDPRQQLEVLALCRRLAGSGRLVLAALHDLNLAALFAEGLVFLKEGRLVGAGATRELLQPGLLEEVYGVPFAVLEHQGRRVVLPEPG
ncbi:ABC transporter ATP-binding protein [Meiothermus sp. QL-1]|uniref:ABC transporter ATP-binding protein n=1 Tax=Meiothermus sp. QL-1 TaxID=2058095 RepID=UPI000E0B84BD|nr:ABC transporter ATP-binding protein [Meiothermus sp. QL-1]RDI95206.1 ABC transporter ATP-binding protein [Meiothermus sp. QL-1]